MQYKYGVRSTKRKSNESQKHFFAIRWHCYKSQIFLQLLVMVCIKYILQHFLSKVEDFF